MGALQASTDKVLLFDLGANFGGRGVLLCETGTKVLERTIFAWISSVNAVRASSISGVVFGVLNL